MDLEACIYNFLVSQYSNYSLFFFLSVWKGQLPETRELVTTWSTPRPVYCCFLHIPKCMCQVVCWRGCFMLMLQGLLYKASSKMMSYSIGTRLRPSQTSTKSLKYMIGRVWVYKICTWYLIIKFVLIYLFCVKFLLINTIIVVILRSV